MGFTNLVLAFVTRSVKERSRLLNTRKFYFKLLLWLCAIFFCLLMILLLLLLLSYSIFVLFVRSSTQNTQNRQNEVEKAKQMNLLNSYFA